eukprot:gene1821-20619_t
MNASSWRKSNGTPSSSAWPSSLFTNALRGRQTRAGAPPEGSGGDASAAAGAYRSPWQE